MVLSQAELDRLFPPPLAPHCEGCHPYGQKAAETFVEDPETGTRMACDSGAPHTHKLCRRHIFSGDIVISTGSQGVGGDPYGRSTEELAPGEDRQIAPGDRPEGSSPLHPDDSRGVAELAELMYLRTHDSGWWERAVAEGGTLYQRWMAAARAERARRSGEGRQIAPGDRPEGASPPHPRERGLHWAPSAPQSPGDAVADLGPVSERFAYRYLTLGVCETHCALAKDGKLEARVSWPVSPDKCVLHLFEGRDAEMEWLEKELEQAQGWVNTITEQRDAARAETRSFQKELAEVHEAYITADRAAIALSLRLKRMKTKATAAKGKAKKKRKARR